jgi:lipoprotein-anchoring transpeptidase ErfK/SrfK
LAVSLVGCSGQQPQNNQANPAVIPQGTFDSGPEESKGKQSGVVTSVDWREPSGGEYPKLEKGTPVWIDVSIKDQRVYIKKGEDTIYTMITSSGLDTGPDTSTPRGTYFVEPERGLSFFAPQYQQGAKYWVSWKNHGEFLFHSVATDANGNVIEDEAKKLGQKASHGCLRLTMADAKWIFENIPERTKVVIRE